MASLSQPACARARGGRLRGQPAAGGRRAQCGHWLSSRSQPASRAVAAHLPAGPPGQKTSGFWLLRSGSRLSVACLRWRARE